MWKDFDRTCCQNGFHWLIYQTETLKEMGKPQFIFLWKDKLWFGFSQMKWLDYPNLSCTWSEVFGIQITSINSNCFKIFRMIHVCRSLIETKSKENPNSCN